MIKKAIQTRKNYKILKT